MRKYAAPPRETANDNMSTRPIKTTDDRIRLTYVYEGL